MSEILDDDGLREATCSEEFRALRDCLDVLGGKWKLIILRYLINREQQEIHFKKIERGLEGISAKMLSKELKELEDNLLVCRKVDENHGNKVFYSITAYGKTVVPLTTQLVEWGIEHRQKIKNK